MALILLLLTLTARPFLRGGQTAHKPRPTSTPTNALIAESGTYLITGDGSYLVWG